MKLAPLILLPVITLVGVLLSGCSLGQSEADANSSPDPGTAEYLDKEASALADSLGITARPDAELIRMIDRKSVV